MGSPSTSVSTGDPASMNEDMRQGQEGAEGRGWERSREIQPTLKAGAQSLTISCTETLTFING